MSISAAEFIEERQTFVPACTKVPTTFCLRAYLRGQKQRQSGHKLGTMRQLWGAQICPDKSRKIPHTPGGGKGGGNLIEGKGFITY